MGTKWVEGVEAGQRAKRSKRSKIGVATTSTPFDPFGRLRLAAAAALLHRAPMRRGGTGASDPWDSSPATFSANSFPSTPAGAGSTVIAAEAMARGRARPVPHSTWWTAIAEQGQPDRAAQGRPRARSRSCFFPHRRGRGQGED